MFVAGGKCIQKNIVVYKIYKYSGLKSRSDTEII